MNGFAVTVSFRRRSGEVVEDPTWAAVPIALLRSTVPWRTFRWHKGQRHYSGTYWSATVRDHVIYESRLELSRLLFADFDEEIASVVLGQLDRSARANRPTSWGYHLVP